MFPVSRCKVTTVVAGAQPGTHFRILVTEKNIAFPLRSLWSDRALSLTL